MHTNAKPPANLEPEQAFYPAPLHQQKHAYSNALQEKYSLHQLCSSPKTIAMSRRAILGVGIPLLGAGGYYFYSAGGDSKVAQKKAERIRS